LANLQAVVPHLRLLDAEAMAADGAQDAAAEGWHIPGAIRAKVPTGSVAAGAPTSTAPGYEHDAERRFLLHAPAHQVHVARLEHAQRQHAAGKSTC